jgi:Arc/MetJ family transcription regulator
VVLDLILGRHLEVHAMFRELVLERLHDELSQRHRRVDLGANDEEAPGDERGLVGHRGVGEHARELGMLRDGGDDGHEVRLTGAVVADDEEALVVGRRLELKLREHQVRELLAHPVGDDEGLDKATGTGRAIGFAELNDGLDGVELDEVRVVHAECSWAGSWLSACPPLSGTPSLDTMSA